MDVLDEPTSLPEKVKQLEAVVEAPARSGNRRKKVCHHYSFSFYLDIYCGCIQHIFSNTLLHIYSLSVDIAGVIITILY